jgi:TolA-binding protein
MINKLCSKHIAVACSWMVIAASAAFAAQSSTPNSSDLIEWQSADSLFQKAGNCIGQGEIEQAKKELTSRAGTLAAPYKKMASDFTGKLDAGVKLSTNAQDPKRVAALVDLCSQLRAHKAALQLQLKTATAADLADDALYAWRLVESGDVKAGRAEYARKLSAEIIETWQEYYQKQIRLLDERATNMTQVRFVLDWVNQRYLKGMEAEADLFGSLRELTRVVPNVKTSKEAALVFPLIMQCLGALGDESGREAWQKKFLTDFGSDPEVAAGVYIDQARKAYRDKNVKGAQELFQKVCSEYPDSSAYGDAQYGLGLMLQEQQQCDRAIVEFSKIFPSKVNDYALDPDNNQDCTNYRFKAALRISECFESSKDFVHALEYAKLANDRYKFMSYCKDCLTQTRRNVEDRVRRLEEAAKKVE